MNSSPKKSRLRQASPAAFLRLFYPFHYQVGSAVENALRGDRLNHHQTIILWIIHSAGEDGTAMRRKDIEARICSWFDITSSAISKALRSLARADMPFLTITEDPRSGREKLVTLTADGRQHLDEMIGRSEAFIARIVEGLSDEEIAGGLQFMKRVSEITPTLDQR